MTEPIRKSQSEDRELSEPADVTLVERDEFESHLLREIVENLPDMIFVKDATELRFVRFNQAGEDLLGFSREELIGKNDYDFFPKEEADFFTSKDREVLDGKRLVDISEEPIHTQNNGTRILHTKKIPILDDEGRPRYLLGISEDITERRNTENELRRLNASLKDRSRELERAVAELEAFSASVSHDLRAPLRTLDGFSLMLLDEYGDTLDGRGRGMLERIRTASQNMGNLMDGLLSLARHRHEELVKEPVDLSGLASQILEELQQQSPSRRVSVKVAPGMTTTGDRTLLHDVLKNLIDNAWKFSRRRDVPEIEIGAIKTEQQATYFVRDNGVGFDPQFAHHLFRSFSRLHSDSDFEGNGIGLATVARIVRRHGGQIWAESVPDHGATFYFTLQS